MRHRECNAYSPIFQDKSDSENELDDNRKGLHAFLSMEFSTDHPRDSTALVGASQITDYFADDVVYDAR